MALAISGDLSAKSLCHYYYRQYDHDFQTQNAEGKILLGRKIFEVALPFFALYSPLRKYVTIGMGVCRFFAFSSLDALLSRKLNTKNDSLDRVGLVACRFSEVLSVISVASALFRNSFAMVVATVHDIFLNTFCLIAVMKGKKEDNSSEKNDFLEFSIHLANNALYLSTLLICSGKLLAISLIAQVAMHLYTAQSEFNAENGKFPGLAHLGMAAVRGFQVRNLGR